ncbi:MAG: HEAT repeat domain-containing protein [Planctomycetes bacterium]|nr:HEAT repeat domain-containing protein [Planctomycetota bacterium]
MRSRTRAIIALAVALLGAAGAYYYYNVLPSVRADSEFQEGIRLYESGSYEESIRHLSATLQRPSGTVPPDKRARAVEVLGLIGATYWDEVQAGFFVRAASSSSMSQILQVLKTSLCDEDRTVRRAIVHALGMTQVVEAADPLIGALKDQDASVRREAVFALAALYNANPFRTAPLGDEGPATELRGQMTAAEKAVHRALAAAIKDDDAGVRERAAIAFGRIGERDEHRYDPRAGPLLREAIQDDSFAVRIYAHQALHFLLWHSRVEDQRKALQADAVELLIKALEHEDWTVRYKAADVLFTIHDASVVEPLHKACQDEYQPVRLAAARALGRIHERTREVFGAYEELLSGVEQEASIGPLIAALSDGDSAVRHQVAQALAAIGEPAIEALQKASSVTDSRGRLGAALALGMIQRDVATQAFNGRADRESLAESLRTEDDAGRQTAAELAGMLGDKTLVEPLVAALADKHSNVRYRAAEALGRIGDSAAVEPLIKALGDPHQGVGVKAAEALGEIRDPRAVEPLIELMKGADHSASHFAREALYQIGAPAVPALIANLGYQGPPWAAPRGAILSGELIGYPGVLGYPCANEFPIPLGKIGESAVEPLIGALRNDDPIARNAALLALAIVWATSPYREPSLEDHRIEILTSEYSVVRGNLFRAFSRGDVWVPTESFKPLPMILGIRVMDFPYVFPEGSPRPFPKIPDDTTNAAVDAVVGVLKDASRREDKFGRARDVQRAAVLALSNIQSPRAVDHLLKLVTEPSFPSDALPHAKREITRLAAGALGRIKDKQSVPRWIEALKDRRVVSNPSEVKEKFRVRDYAARALGEIGDPRAIEPLEEARKDEDEDEEFRQRVTEALAKIKGEQLSVTH